jgi:GNAT superfamily N-acetyltransferase
MTAAARQTENHTPAPSIGLPHPKTLADGRQVTIRPIRQDDVQRNAAFLESLSPPSRHFLFLGAISRLNDEQLRRLCDVDHAEDMAFVALAVDPRNPAQQVQVGVCRYAGARDASQGAEISVAVADDWQHQGLGKMLLRHLIAYARTHGVPRLYSIDSVYNDRMRKLARHLGFAEQTDPQDRHQVIYSIDLRWQ